MGNQKGGELPNDANGAPQRNWIRVAAWCLLGLLFCNTSGILLDPGMPDAGLDGSWVYPINQAVAQRMAFGHDIIFTYGPYASVWNHTYHPATVWMMLLGSLLFDVCYACCFAWLVRPAAWSWTLILVAMLFAPLVRGDAAAYSYMLLEVLFVFRLLDEETREGSKPMRVLLAAAIFGCAGMLPLVKCSFAAVQAGVSALCLAFLILHRRWMIALVCAFATLTAMLLFWFAAGQHVAGLPDFLSGSIQAISGYSQAMSLPGQRRQTVLFLAGALAVLLAIVLARSLRRSLKLYLLLAYAFYLLVSFKEGFVRQDDHVYVALVALALASLFLMLLQTPQRKRFSPVLCSIALVATMTVIGFLWRSDFADAVQEGGTDLGNWKLLKLAVETEPQLSFLLPRNFSLRPWHERFDDARREINANSNLDFNLQGSVDVYSYEQSALLSRGYDWGPRPVFQSYSAYTPELIRINEQHLRGTEAPDHIVFQLETIDDRLPTLDDGLSWPAMLDNYRVAAVSGKWVHLARKSGSIASREPFHASGKSIGATWRGGGCAAGNWPSLRCKSNSLLASTDDW